MVAAVRNADKARNTFAAAGLQEGLQQVRVGEKGGGGKEGGKGGVGSFIL